MNIPKKLVLLVALLLTGCASTQKKYTETTQLDLAKMMGPWYVMAGRFTSLEKNVHKICLSCFHFVVKKQMKNETNKF